MRDVTLNVGEELGRLNAHMGLIQLNPSDSTEVGNYFGEILFSTHPYPIVDDEEQMRQLQEGILTDIKGHLIRIKIIVAFIASLMKNKIILSMPIRTVIIS